MPYVRVGKCVYRKNADGSRGDLKGCSETEEEAKKYMRALYVHETKSVDAVASPNALHGPGSLLGVPGMGGKPAKVRKRMTRKYATDGIVDKMFPALSAGVKTKESESLDAEREQTVQQFNEQFPSDYGKVASSSTNIWVVEVYSDYVIASVGPDYFKVTYTGSGDTIEFAPRDEWEEVERKTEWDTVVKEARKKKDAESEEFRGEKPGTDGHSGYLVRHDNGTASLPTGKNGKPDRGLAGGAWAALFSKGGHRGKPYSGPNKAEAKKKLRGLYDREGWDYPTTTKEASLSIVKGADGDWRWVLFSSSIYEDRDGEVVSKAMHQKDVAELNRTKEFGPLRWWHVGTPTDDDPEPESPPLDIGTCDFSAMHNGIRVESGTFEDERIGDAFAVHAKELSASLAFSHSHDQPDGTGIFTKGHTIERSALPREHASNVLADLFTHKEKTMDSTKVKELEGLLGTDGPSIIKELLADADHRESIAQQLGVRSKEAKRKEGESEDAYKARRKKEDEAKKKEDEAEDARKEGESEAEAEARRKARKEAEAKKKEDEAAKKEDESEGEAVRHTHKAFPHLHKKHPGGYGVKESEAGFKHVHDVIHSHKEAEAAHKGDEMAMEHAHVKDAEADCGLKQARTTQKDVIASDPMTYVVLKVDDICEKLDLIQVELEQMETRMGFQEDGQGELEEALSATKESLTRTKEADKRIKYLLTEIKELRDGRPGAVRRSSQSDDSEVDNELTKVIANATKEANSTDPNVALNQLVDKLIPGFKGTGLTPT